MRKLIDKPRRKKRERGRRGEGSLKLRGNTWWYIIPSLDPAVKRIEKSCETEDYQQAMLVKQQALIARKQSAGLAPADKLTLHETLAAYALYCEHEKPRSWRSVRGALEMMQGYFGGQLAASLTTNDADKYREHRVKTGGVSHSTVNRELTYLKAAMKRETKTTPPRILRVPYIRMVSEKHCVREGFINREQYQLLLNTLAPPLQALLVCAFHTGARLGELQKITWGQINWEKNVIDLTPKQTKNGEGRWLPIWGDMREYLECQRNIHALQCPSTPWVFFWWEGYSSRAVPGAKITDFRMSWKDACDRAGLKGLLFHDLRRSAIRFADQDAKIPSKLVMMMSGHKTESVYRRYNIGGAKDMERVGKELDEYLRGMKKGGNTYGAAV